MTGGVDGTDGAPSTDCAQGVTAVAELTQERTADTATSLAQSATTAVPRGVPPPLPPGRRRRASMQDALDHTKINTSLYDPTLVR